MKQTNDYTLVGHLSELRTRLFIVLAVNILAIFACFLFSQKAISYYLALNPGMKLIYIAPEEAFSVLISVSILAGIVLCSPFTISQIWGFVAKGLYKKERQAGVLALVMGVFFFILGVLFCYKLVLPFILNFFMQASIPGVSPMLSIREYVSFINTMFLAFGIVFEMPVLVFSLSWFGLLKPHHLKRFHGTLIIIIFIVAAVVTPPDVISQMFMAVPMILLLEFSIFVCKFVTNVRFPEETTVAAKQ